MVMYGSTTTSWGVLDEHARCENLALYIHRMNETEDHAMDILDPAALIGNVKLTNPTNHGACLSVRREHMLRVNGWEMHPMFEGRHFWGSLDLYTRFKNLGLHVMWHPDLRCYHAWHPWPASPTENLDAQKEIMRRRLYEMEHLAYRGLDPDLAYDPPWLEEWKEEYSTRQGKRKKPGRSGSGTSVEDHKETMREGIRRGWCRALSLCSARRGSLRVAIFGAGMARCAYPRMGTYRQRPEAAGAIVVGAEELLSSNEDARNRMAELVNGTSAFLSAQGSGERLSRC